MTDADAATVEVTITRLEMEHPPTSPPPPVPLGRLALMRAERPPVHFYRYLYDTVGEDWLWWERRLMSDTELAAILADAHVELLILYVDGVPAGYAELDGREAPDIEIAYFGLMPEFIGRGYGRYLMRAALDAAWAMEPKRVWLHTCTLDHPGALTFYQRMGFTPYDRETKEIENPRATGAFG